MSGAERALICDTSVVLAALDRSDPEHQACASVLTGHEGPLILSPLVLAELDHLVRQRLGGEAARRLADDVGDGAYDLAVLQPADIAECVAQDRRYAELGLGLTDASLIVLALRHQTRTLLSLDERHLRAVVPLQGGAFRLLPMDGSAAPA